MGHITISDLSNFVPFAGDHSYALLTTAATANRAVVFLHGFGGDPYKTWSRFQDLMQTHPDWAQTDAFFLTYNSIADEVMLSASYFAEALQHICPKPPSSLFSRPNALDPTVATELRVGPVIYDTLTIVGHSLGGIVVRAAIRHIFARTHAEVSDPAVSPENPTFHSPILSANVILFAPAQGGARLAGLKGIAAKTVGFRALVGMFQGRSPSFQELASGELLGSIRDDTDYFASRYPSIEALKARIAWAHHDTVVTALPYRHDMSFTILGTTHASICKPGRNYQTPMKFVSTGQLGNADGAI